VEAVITIDPFDSEFLPTESQALVRLIAKVEQYRIQGRFWEAQAMVKAVNIVWMTLKCDADMDKSNWADL
jgi:hypothetical protein